ncbi:hypothetical protein HKX48_002451 [Thoreauomyces humboldtii]|nr:hypothetical protein HKX48_002451 [Thoreauomyces humboldtii]
MATSLSTASETLHALGCVSGFAGVALGAFGAHGLGKRLAGVVDAQAKISNWRVAATYQLVHAMAILYVSGRMGSDTTGRRSPAAGYLFGAGNLLFAGSIYMLVLDAKKVYSKRLGPVTPVGGLLYLAGWMALLWC